jgi:hypothetical protein
MVSTAQTGPQFLAEQLERLLSLPLDSKADVEQWYSEAQAVQSAFDRFPAFEFPHHIWHYFADADIRQRDLEYRESQEKKIRDYIAEIRASRTI